MKKKKIIIHIFAAILSTAFLCSCAKTENPAVITQKADFSGIAMPVEIPTDEVNSFPITTETFSSEDITDAATEAEAVPSEEITAGTAAEKPVIKVLKDNIDYAEFDKKIAECAKNNSVVGMGLCVFADGRVVYETDLGFADKENGILCDENTRYRVASVSKLVSSMTLMTLYDEGKIEPYSNLQELTGIHYNYNDEDVLLWHLTTHTAGIADGYTYDESPKNYYTVSHVLENSHTGAKPGTQYCYSNLGMGTVGAIVEVITGEFFHDYADKAVFSKLGMDAAYCADMLKDRSSCANLYSEGKLYMQPESWGRTTGYYERFGLGNSYLAAQCELLITPGDLARLGIIISGDGSVDGVRILSQEAVDLINTAYYSDESIPFDMGLSTRIYRGNFIEGRTIYGHPGCALGNVCGLYYDPSDGTGIAVCTNGCNIGTNSENGIYNVIEDCAEAVYDTFFEAPQSVD